ncbi:hypothetical protein GCM10023088_61180 [Actinomadura verrucosospora]
MPTAAPPVPPLPPVPRFPSPASRPLLPVPRAAVPAARARESGPRRRVPGYEVVENVTVRDALPAQLWRRDDVLRPFGFFRLVRAVVRNGR